MKRLLLLTATSVLMFSCSKNDFSDESSKEMVDLTFSVEGNELVSDENVPNSRTSIVFTDKTPNVKWSAGEAEEISVISSVNLTQNYKFVKSNNPEVDATHAEFTGRIAAEDIPSDNSYYGIYPYNVNNKVTVNESGVATYYFSIPAEQTAKAENINYNPSIAKSNSYGNFTFIQPCSLLRIIFSGTSDRIKQIEKLKIETCNSSGNAVNCVGDISGKITITSNNKQVGDELTLVGNASNKITFNKPTDGYFEYGKNYYISMYPCGSVWGLRLYVNDETTNIVDPNVVKPNFRIGYISTITIPINNQ